MILYSGPIVTKAEARAAGLARYFTGVPCKNGHIAQRYTLHRSCVQCINDTQVKRVQENPEGYKAYSKAHYERNKEKILAAHRAKRIANPVHRRLIEKAYKQRNKDKVRARITAWWKAHPDRLKVKKRNNRAKRNAALGKHTAADIAEIRRLQKDRCAEPTCRDKLHGNGHVDHITALARGGSNDRRNLQLLCHRCNQRKSDKDPIEFAREFGRFL